MKKLLLVVDYQTDFVNGALGFPGAEKLDSLIAKKIARKGAMWLSPWTPTRPTI